MRHHCSDYMKAVVWYVRWRTKMLQFISGQYEKTIENRICRRIVLRDLERRPPGRILCCLLSFAKGLKAKVIQIKSPRYFTRKYRGLRPSSYNQIRTLNTQQASRLRKCSSLLHRPVRRANHSCVRILQVCLALIQQGAPFLDAVCSIRRLVVFVGIDDLRTLRIEARHEGFLIGAAA